MHYKMKLLIIFDCSKNMVMVVMQYTNIQLFYKLHGFLIFDSREFIISFN